jgi:hypothetical protein
MRKLLFFILLFPTLLFSQDNNFNHYKFDNIYIVVFDSNNNLKNKKLQGNEVTIFHYFNKDSYVLYYTDLYGRYNRTEFKFSKIDNGIKIYIDEFNHEYFILNFMKEINTISFILNLEIDKELTGFLIE